MKKIKNSTSTITEFHSINSFLKYLYGKITLEEYRKAKTGYTVTKIKDLKDKDK